MTKYPLMDNAEESLRAASGRNVADIKLETVAEFTSDDLQISAETLQAQAQIARDAGYTQLAANLTRAAELTAVPNDELLQMYDLLRPGRARYETLIALAERLENNYKANETGKFVREAASTYQARGLLRRET